MSDHSEPPQNPTIDDLKSLLFHGLNETLVAASKEDVLSSPYGRPEQLTIEKLDAKMNEPSDSESEDDITKDDDEEKKDENTGNDDEDSEDDSDEEVHFSYKYGFNPLIFLGQYLKRNNPKNIALKKQKTESAINFLTKRATHGLLQLSVASEIETLSARLLTGIDLGPSTGNLTATSVLLWCQSSTRGTVIFDVSTSPTFPEKDTDTQQAIAGEKENDPFTASVSFQNLTPATTYYFRVCLETEDGKFPGVVAGNFVSGSFTTLCDCEESKSVSFYVSSIGNNGAGRLFEHVKNSSSKNANAGTNRNEASFMLLLGSILPPQEVADIMANVGSSREQLYELRRSFRKAWKTTPSLMSLCETLPILCAFNDASNEAQAKLRSEEKALDPDANRKSSSSRKSRKTKSDSSSSATPPLKSFSEFFPASLVRKPTRHLYSKVELGANAELFVLDTRNLSLGKLQLKWLCGALENSMSTWKIVSCVSSANYERSANQDVEVPFDDETEREAQINAATKIQARARGRSERKVMSKKGGDPSTLKRDASSSSISSSASIRRVVDFIKNKNIQNVIFVTCETRSSSLAKINEQNEDGEELNMYEFCVAPSKFESAPKYDLLASDPEEPNPTTNTNLLTKIADEGSNSHYTKVTVNEDSSVSFRAFDHDSKLQQKVTIKPKTVGGENSENGTTVDEGKVKR